MRNEYKRMTIDPWLIIHEEMHGKYYYELLEEIFPSPFPSSGDGEGQISLRGEKSKKGGKKKKKGGKH